MTFDDHIKYGSAINDLRKRDTRNSTEAGEKLLEELRQAGQTNTTTLEVGNFSTASKFLGSYPIKGGDTEEFEVLIRSFNRPTLTERVNMKVVNNHWSKALIVELPTNKNHAWTKIDKDFPRINGHLDVNWPRPVQGRAEWDH